MRRVAVVSGSLAALPVATQAETPPAGPERDAPELVVDDASSCGLSQALTTELADRDLRGYVVRVAEEAGQPRATLDDPRGGRREVGASDCEGLVRAVLVILSLGTEVRVAPPEPDVLSDPRFASGLSPRAVGAVDLPSFPPWLRSELAGEAGRGLADPTPPRGPRLALLELGGDFEAGLTPGSFGGVLGVRIALASLDALFGVELHVRGRYQAPTLARSSRYPLLTTDIELAAGLVGLALRATTGPLDLAVELSVEGGALSGRGRLPSVSRAGGAFYWAAELSLHAVLSVLGDFGLFVEVGGVAPLLRPSFFVTGLADGVIHRPADFGVVAALGPTWAFR